MLIKRRRDCGLVFFYFGVQIETHFKRIECAQNHSFGHTFWTRVSFLGSDIPIENNHNVLKPSPLALISDQKSITSSKSSPFK